MSETAATEPRDANEEEEEAEAEATNPPEGQDDPGNEERAKGEDPIGENKERPQTKEEQEEEAELAARTQEQEAADERNRERDSKCNCSKENCKSGCQKFMSGLAFTAFVNLFTAAFMVAMMVIMLQIEHDQTKAFNYDIILETGPGGTVVAPRMDCKINDTHYRCARYALGAVKARCECNQDKMAENLWVELRKQRRFMKSLKRFNFKKQKDYNTARRNVQDMITTCAPELKVDEYLKRIGENHHCFLIGLNNIVNWIPESVLDFKKYGPKKSLAMLRSRPDAKQASTDWAHSVSLKLHNGYTPEEAVQLANEEFGMGNLWMFDPKLPCPPGKYRSGNDSMGPCVDYQDRKSYFGQNILDRAHARNSATEETGKYIPVFCEAHYPGTGIRVVLETTPKDGLFIPGFNVYRGDKEGHAKSAVAIILPRRLYAEVAEVECVFIARNIRFRDSSGGHLKFLFSYTE